MTRRNNRYVITYVIEACVTSTSRRFGATVSPVQISSLVQVESCHHFGLMGVRLANRRGSLSL